MFFFRYGFYTNHCCEALIKAENDFEKALEILSVFYFKVNFKRTTKPVSCAEREDEMVALMSIYNDMCDERVKNKHWVFHLYIPHLGAWFFKNTFKNTENQPQQRKKPICRNFNSTGNCRFGSNCKFSHEISNTPNKTAYQEAELKLKCSFNLEIRFPEG